MKKENKTFSARGMAEIAIMTAIAFGLDFLQGGLWRGVFVNGGSIGLAMVPILVLCYRRGFLSGLISGIVLAFLQMLGGVYAIADSWYKVLFQILLDYVLAYPVVAVAGLFYVPFQNAKSNKEKIGFVAIGSTIGGILKFLCHFLAGVLFWPNNALGGKYTYSLIYNGGYMLPNIILSIAIMIVLVVKVPSVFNYEKGGNKDEQ